MRKVFLIVGGGATHLPELSHSWQCRSCAAQFFLIGGGAIIEALEPTQIFEPNFTTKSSGTGLGLAMVKRIIDDLNGDLYFTTELGLGTTFYVSIPLLKQKV